MKERILFAWLLAFLAASIPTALAAEFTLDGVPIKLGPTALGTLTSATAGVGRTEAVTIPISGTLTRPAEGLLVAGELTFIPGASFVADKDTVVSWVTAFNGELTFGATEPKANFKVQQYNFLNQAARVNYRASTSKIVFVLPTILSSPGRQDTHVFLFLSGRIEADNLVVTSLKSAMEKMVTRAFPGSPRFEGLLGISTLEETQAVQPMGPANFPCCWGAWCCSCGYRDCSHTVCPGACLDCWERSCGDCQEIECPACCSN